MAISGAAAAQYAKMGIDMAQNIEARAQQGWNTGIQRSTAKFQAADSIVASQGNIANAEQQKILSSVTIDSDRRKAEAAAKVSAAVAGAEGSAVDATIQQTQTTAVLAQQGLERQTDNQIEAMLDNVYNAAYDFSIASTVPPDVNGLKELMKGGLSAAGGFAVAKFGIF